MDIHNLFGIFCKDFNIMETNKFDYEKRIRVILVLPLK